MEIQSKRLKQVHMLAQKAGVSYSISYEDGSGLWHFKLHELGGEDAESRDTSFELMMVQLRNEIRSRIPEP